MATTTDVARRCARATGYDLAEWQTAAHAWWSAGHDLDRLAEWVEGEQDVSPALVLETIPTLAAFPTPVGPPIDPDPDRFTVWVQRVVIVAVAAALVALLAAVAVRAVVWILP